LDVHYEISLASLTFCSVPRFLTNRETQNGPQRRTRRVQYQYRICNGQSMPWNKARLDGLRQLQLVNSDRPTSTQQTLVPLLSLLSPASFSLFVYLSVFFNQLPLSPEEWVLKMIFGHTLLGCSCAVAAKSGMAWLLTRFRSAGCVLREEGGDNRKERIGITASDAPQDEEVCKPFQVDLRLARCQPCPHPPPHTSLDDCLASGHVLLRPLKLSPTFLASVP
jgi:hypothetical protein